MVRHAFLSFMYEDMDLVRMFRGQAKNKNNSLAFDDYSITVAINSTSAAYVKSKISEKIRASSVTICLIGRLTSTSEWVDWEIRRSRELNKRVFGVRLHSDSSVDKTPQSLIEIGAPIMNWEIEKIVNAIG